MKRLILNDTEIFGSEGGGLDFAYVMQGFDVSTLDITSSYTTDISVPYSANKNFFQGLAGASMSKRLAKEKIEAKIILDTIIINGFAIINGVNLQNDEVNITFFDQAAQAMASLYDNKLSAIDMGREPDINPVRYLEDYINLRDDGSGVVFPIINWGAITNATMTNVDELQWNLIDLFPVVKLEMIIRNAFAQIGVSYDPTTVFADPIIKSLAITHEGNYRAQKKELALRFVIKGNDINYNGIGKPAQDQVASLGFFPEQPTTAYAGVKPETYNSRQFTGEPAQSPIMPDGTVYYFPFIIDPNDSGTTGLGEIWQLTQGYKTVSPVALSIDTPQFFSSTRFKVRARIKGTLVCYLEQREIGTIGIDKTIYLKIGVGYENVNSSDYSLLPSDVVEIYTENIKAPDIGYGGVLVIPGPVNYYYIEQEIDIFIEQEIDLRDLDYTGGGKFNLVYSLIRESITIGFSDPLGNLYLDLTPGYSYWEMSRINDLPYSGCQLDIPYNLPNISFGDLIKFMNVYFGLVQHSFGGVLYHKLFRDIVRDKDSAEDWTDTLIYDNDELVVTESLANYSQKNTVIYSDDDNTNNDLFLEGMATGSFDLDIPILQKQQDFYSAPFSVSYLSQGYGRSMLRVNNIKRTTDEAYDDINDSDISSITARIMMLFESTATELFGRPLRLYSNFENEKNLASSTTDDITIALFGKLAEQGGVYNGIFSALTYDDCFKLRAENLGILPDEGLKTMFLQELIQTIEGGEQWRPKLRLTIKHLKNGCLTLKYFEGRGYYFLSMIDQYDPDTNETICRLWKVC